MITTNVPFFRLKLHSCSRVSERDSGERDSGGKIIAYVVYNGYWYNYTSFGKEHQFLALSSRSLWQEDFAVAIIDVLRYYTLAIIGIIIYLFFCAVAIIIDSVRNSLPLRRSDSLAFFQRGTYAI